MISRGNPHLLFSEAEFKLQKKLSRALPLPRRPDEPKDVFLFPAKVSALVFFGPSVTPVLDTHPQLFSPSPFPPDLLFFPFTY